MLSRSLSIAVMAVLLAACGGKTDATPTAEAKAKATPPAPPPPAAAAPAPAGGDAKVTPKKTPPFESIRFTRTAEAEKGWPKFDAVNLGDKKISFAAITGFAYDKGGKLVKKTAIPLSWNSTLEPGGKAMFPVSVGGFEKEPVTADKFELCYDSLKYDGEDKFVEDKTLCTDSRPVGGVKSAGGDAAASAEPSAKAHAGRGGKHGKKK